jgi:hypothetical protein
MHGGHLGVSSVETERRLKICGGCDRFRTDGFCAECGCYIRLKARMATETCPLNKWTIVAPEKTTQPRILMGEQLFAKELELRAIVPPEHSLAQTFNRFHAEEQQGGCGSCRRRAFGRTLAAALQEFLSTASPDDIHRVQALFPETTHIEGLKVAKAWATIEQRSAVNS